ncbi:MAG: hypothetical protein JWN70_2394 [Planctomycetaceae bacterium]|nr:hypothetical protein [Planctomycetaceae bacterium]
MWGPESYRADCLAKDLLPGMTGHSAMRLFAFVIAILSWSLNDGSDLARVQVQDQPIVQQGHTGGITSVAYSPDGSHIVTGFGESKRPREPVPSHCPIQDIYHVIAVSAKEFPSPFPYPFHVHTTDLHPQYPQQQNQEIIATH